jgi:hypothetical protein
MYVWGVTPFLWRLCFLYQVHHAITNEVTLELLAGNVLVHINEHKLPFAVDLPCPKRCAEVQLKQSPVKRCMGVQLKQPPWSHIVQEVLLIASQYLLIDRG